MLRDIHVPGTCLNTDQEAVSNPWMLLVDKTWRVASTLRYAEITGGLKEVLMRKDFGSNFEELLCKPCG